jgi:hypothetical protein
MSRINDALKQAQQRPPGNLSTPRPIFRTDDHEPSRGVIWLVSALAILIIAAACFCLGWIISNRNTDTSAAGLDTNTNPEPVATLPLPAIHSTVTNLSTGVTNEPVPVPVLQGILYSPTSPSAILNGKNVQPGDQIGSYRVKAISKYTVTLVGADDQEIQVGM